MLNKLRRINVKTKFEHKTIAGEAVKNGLTNNSHFDMRKNKIK